MILRLTDGTTTISLTNGTDDIWIRRGGGYVPSAPQVSVTQYESLLRDGGDVVNVKRLDVEESVEVYFNPVGDTLSDAQDALNAVEALFAQAIHRSNTGKGAAVYVEYDPDDGGTPWRSEISYGRITLADGAEKLHRIGVSQGLVSWRRKFYWEGAETELALYNPSVVSKQTGGVTVECTTDTTPYYNYVDIDGGDVDGVIPSPLEISLFNSYNVVPRTYNMHLAANIFAEPATFDHILEGEDADYIAGGAAATVDANSSEGEYQVATWAGDAYTRIFSWDLNTVYLNKCKGYRFRILGRLVAGTSSGVRAKLRITFAGVTTVLETPSVALDEDTVQDFGVVRLPPWLRGSESAYQVRLDIYAQKTGGASVYLDFIQVTPVDGYRVLNPQGYGVDYQWTLVDDGVDDLLYVAISGARAGYYAGRGDRLVAWPGRDMRIYFLCDTSTADVQVARTHTMRVYYRPRRLTL